MALQKMQNRYEILTDKGWSEFHGVRKSKTSEIVKISLEDKKTLKCTSNHLLECKEGFCEAKELTVGQEIKTTDGWKKIESKRYYKENNDVFDALQVEKGNVYLTNGIVSHNCGFLGSSGTLISGEKLKSLTHDVPIVDREGIKQYIPADKNRTYAMTVDVSRGKGLDYSTFSVIDVSEMPYKQVCVFRDNFIGPVDYADIIHRIAKLYNDAYVLIEINDIGGQVADTLFMDFGYENVLFTESAGRSGKRISGGFGKNVDRGIRTTKTVKSIGCSILKLLIEQEQLIIPDFETIQELSRFSKKGNSYEAESGAHDDMVMTLVLFAWLSDQGYFKDMTDINTLMKLREKSEEQLEEELLPFGFIDDGVGDVEEPYYPSSNFLL